MKTTISKHGLKPCPKCKCAYPIPFRNLYNAVWQWTIYCDECGHTTRYLPTFCIARWIWNHLR